MTAVIQRPISAATRICGVWGQPIRHSASPAMHNAAFAALKLDYCYVAFTVAPHDLPSALQKELAMHIHADVIEKVPIFKGATDAFIKEIVMKLTPAMFTPGDYVFREGEIGHNMYFISRGSVEILSEKSGQVFASISEGGYFGEIALLMDSPRNASVKAIDYCDLYTLDKDSFQMVLQRFPAFAKQVRKIAGERIHHGGKMPKKSAKRR